MPTELEELVDFLHHGNTQIRQIAVENLVPYSKADSKIFKSKQLAPVKDLKMLVKDYPPIAKNALTILINLSADLEVLKELAEDDALLETVLSRLMNFKEPTKTELCMLLANLAKSPSLERLVTLERSPVPNLPTTSQRAIAQLIDIYNVLSVSQDSYDHLAYLFSDLARHPSFTAYLTTTVSPDPLSLDPLTSFLPQTSHASHVRRLGTALLFRNIALAHPNPLHLLQPPNPIIPSILPAILIPLCSSNQENITEEEMELLPEECQLLPPEHRQERDEETVLGLVEALWLLCARGGRTGREVVRGKGAGGYVVVRELHLGWEEKEGKEEKGKGVRDWCEKIVDLLMGDDVTEEKGVDEKKGRVEEVEEEEDEEDVVPIF